MVWGKTCWFAHPESTFPLPNTFHAVLSSTLEWVLSLTNICFEISVFFGLPRNQSQISYCSCENNKLFSSYSSPPDHAHFVCSDLEAAVRLAGSPPLADLIETIWIVGGVQVYKVSVFHWSLVIHMAESTAGKLVLANQLWPLSSHDSQHNQLHQTSIRSTPSACMPMGLQSCVQMFWHITKN